MLKRTALLSIAATAIAMTSIGKVDRAKITKVFRIDR